MLPFGKMGGGVQDLSVLFLITAWNLYLKKMKKKGGQGVAKGVTLSMVY